MRKNDVGENEGDLIKLQTSKTLFNGSTNNKIKTDTYAFESKGNHIAFEKEKGNMTLKTPKGVKMYIQGNKKHEGFLNQLRIFTLIIVNPLLTTVQRLISSFN